MCDFICNAMAEKWRFSFSICTLFTLFLLCSQVCSTLSAGVNLGPSEALLTVRNERNSNLTVSTTVNICYKCPPTPLCAIEEEKKSQCNFVQADHNVSFFVESSYFTTLFINYANSTPLCNLSIMFSEHALYLLVVNNSEPYRHLITMNTGDGEYLPILYAAIAMIGLAILWVCLVYGYKLMLDKGLKYCHFRAVDRAAARDLGVPSPPSTYGTTDEQKPLVKANGSLNSSMIGRGTCDGKTGAETSPTPKKKSRLKSLDAFRGFSLAIMIFVNFGGGGYWFFNHSKWNGLTVADLVFPWFIWIMGVSLVFSFTGRKKDSVWMKLYQIIRRTIILFGLGLFLNSDKDDFTLETWRIPGVLQRFAVSYFVVALAELVSVGLNGWIKKKHCVCSCWEPISDLAHNWLQWLLIFLLEFLHLSLTFLLPGEGCPSTGYLGPGGISEGGKYENCTGGAAGIIDRWILGESHLYQHPTSSKLYQLKQPYDPEGILGSLNSIVLCFLGVQAGRVLVLFKGHHIGIIVRFTLWGVLLGVLSALLCEGQLNEGAIPINKNLWSLSYILAMSGSGFILLALFYFLIDVVKLWNGAPFKYPGMNSIMVYVGHEVLEDYFPFRWPHQEDNHLIFLSANLIGAGLWMFIAYYCYYIGFFVKI